MPSRDNIFNIFPADINPESKKYESEDYGFCNLWRSLGGKIYIDPTIQLQHFGSVAYEGSLTSQANIYKNG